MMAPSLPGDPGRGVDLGGRLIGKGGVILPPPPANCPPDYRAKYIRVFGVDPGCTPMEVRPPTPYVHPIGTGPGTNNPETIPVESWTVPDTTVAPSTPSVPVTPVHRIRARPLPRVHVKKAPPTGRGDGEICPSYGHVNRQIPGVDEYQVVACTPGQRVKIDRGLARTVRSEALARHPGGGRERAGQAGDYQGSGSSSGGYSSSSSSAAAAATVGATSGSICLSPMVLIGAAAVLFFMMKGR